MSDSSVGVLLTIISTFAPYLSFFLQFNIGFEQQVFLTALKFVFYYETFSCYFPEVSVTIA